MFGPALNVLKRGGVGGGVCKGGGMVCLVVFVCVRSENST